MVDLFRQRDRTPYINRPKVFFDLETTGLKAGYNEVTEAAFCHETKGSLCIQIKPDHPDRWDEESRKISGYRESAWADSISFKEAAPKIIEYLEGVIIIGHNVLSFDLPFLEAAFKMHGLESWRISEAVIDTRVLAMAHLIEDGLKMANLKACCKFFDIDNEGAHRAYDDVLRTKQVYESIMLHIRNKSFGQRELFG